MEIKWVKIRRTVRHASFPLPITEKQVCGRLERENLYECMAELRVPLLNIISELYDEGIKAKAYTIGITPVLAEQLNDEHLKQGYNRLSW